MNHTDSPFAFSGGDRPRETPDMETASEGYAGRFAGPVGAWFLQTQAQSTLELLRPWPGGRVLELGGGHAQLATASPSPAARLARLMPPGSYDFVACDLHKLPFPDQSLEVATAFRLLAHVQDWSGLLAELCRVARHAVVVDYAEKLSVNLIAERLFAAKQAVGENTRPFQCFYGKNLASQLTRLGFTGLARRPQFFLPMALCIEAWAAWA